MPFLWSSSRSVSNSTGSTCSTSPPAFQTESFTRPADMIGRRSGNCDQPSKGSSVAITPNRGSGWMGIVIGEADKLNLLAADELATAGHVERGVVPTGRQIGQCQHQLF